MQTLPTDYSHQQLVDALQTEFIQLMHDVDPTDDDFTIDEHLDYLNAMSHDELITETSTDDIFTLSDFMSTYGWCLPPAFTVGCRLHVYHYPPYFTYTMLTYQSSSFISYIRTNVLRGTCDVQLKDGKFYTYYNVSRRALLNLELNKSVSLGFWFNRNCVNSNATSSLVFDVNKDYVFATVWV